MSGGQWSHQHPPGYSLSYKDRRAQYQAGNRDQRHRMMNNNRFALLSDENGSGNANNIPDDKANGNDGCSKARRPPPIEIYALKLSVVKTGIGKLGLKDVEFRLVVLKTDKNTRENIKVYTHNNDDYNRVKQWCDDNKIQYHSHPLYDDRTVKICLYGLCEIETADIKKEIGTKFKVIPTDVKLITPKKGHPGQSRIYVLYFKKSDGVKTADLRTVITGLFNMRVRFEYYSPRKFGPTQCSNCQDFGHGAENCKVSPKCIRCGGLHESKSCLLLITPIDGTSKPKIPDNLVKCANCQEKHTANFFKCPYRISVVQKQERLRDKQRRSNVILRQEEFPALPTVQVSHQKPVQPAAIHSNTWSQHSPPLMPGFQQLIEMQNNMVSTMSNMMNQMMTKMTEMLQIMSKLTEKLSPNNDQ